MSNLSSDENTEEIPGPDPRSGNPTALPRLAAVITAVLGVVVLAVWSFAVPVLKSVLPGAVEMTANTAVGLVLAACALFILCDRPSPPLQRLAQALALAVTALGLATLGQYAFDWRFGIDELLFRDSADAHNIFPGRMSPYSSVAFALIGLALAVLPRPALRPLARLAAIFVMAIGAVTYLGYLWNVSALVTDPWLPPVAMNAAFAFILLGAGTFLANRRPERQRAAGRYIVRASIETRILAGFIGALALLFAAGGYTYRATAEFAESGRRIARTQQIRVEVNRLDASISTAESEQRHYLLTGKPKNKEKYARHAAQVDKYNQSLSRLIADNPGQMQTFAMLRPFIIQRMDSLARQVSVFEREGRSAALADMAGDDGVPAMEAIDVLIDRIDDAETELLLKREADLARTREVSLLALLLMLAVATATLIFLFLGIRREFAARAQAEQALVAAKNEAEQANAAKDIFLATMSHEIRTPLNGLLGMLELLSLSRLEGEQRGMLQIARDSGRGLVRIIDDVLDHAKIAAGKLEIRVEPVSITQLLRRVLNTYHAVASANNVTLKMSVDPRISLSLLADPLRVLQILNNLVSNALKFTPAGYVELRAELLGRAHGASTVRLSVKDTGIGIEPEAQLRLFQPFEQAGAGTARVYGGTGLGLSISRRLAEMMGGTIEVQSAPGEGTTMSLTLTLPISDAVPAERASAATPAVAPILAAAALGAGPLVLAVDDHPTNRELLGRQITALGLRVQTAADGREALALWQAGEYALVVTDCNMPQMDGYALSRAMREIEAKEGRPRTTIIAWTANVLASAATLCHAAGMDDILIKPAELADLRETLSKWLPPVAAAAGPHAAADAAPLAARVAPIDLAQLDKIVANVAERTEILLDFMTEIRSDFSGLRAALTMPDLPACTRIAHRMKGSSGMVGARELAAACETMERAARQGSPEDAGAAKAAMERALQRLEAHFAETTRAKEEKE